MQRTEGLAGAVEVERWKVTARAGGASLEVLASDAASSWGLRPFFTVVDEIAQWPSTAESRRLWESVVSAQPKVPGSRLVVLTTAGDPSHWSRKVLELAQGSEAWRAREVAGPCPWIPKVELKEQRRLLSASQYARLHLNEWTAPEDRLSSLEDVRACVGHGPAVLDPVAGERYVVALDLGVKSDRSVMAVGHLARGASAVEVVLDRMEVWVPVKGRPVELAVVESAVEAAAVEYGGAECVFDPWQAMGMAQRLRGRGVRVSEFTFSQASVGRLAATLHRLLRDRLLDLPDDEDLVDELSHVQLRETAPGIVRMDHASGRHDDRAVALGLAALHLLEGRDSGRGGLRFRGSDEDAAASTPGRSIERFLAGG
ncbi:MAG: hypothetical protein M5U31_04960 [Acidimicrobiia bacterium]|nr:hypothetical protein [Acidimicrobiia bacterium]